MRPFAQLMGRLHFYLVQRLYYHPSGWRHIAIPFLLLAAASKAHAQVPWVAYYGQSAQPESFLPYDIIVLDSDYPNDISFLSEEGKTVLAYISVGEISQQRPYFDEVAHQGLILTENKNWPGSYRVQQAD